MRVYFVRHGESHGNANHQKGGFSLERADRLTERGKVQARELGKRMKRVEAARLIASPLRRARETAEEMNKALKLPLETDGGIFEVRAPDSFYTHPVEKRHRYVPHLFMRAHADDPGYKIEDSESFNESVTRARRLRKRLEGLDESVIAVTHADFIRMFLGDILFGKRFSPEQLNDLWNMQAINTGVTVFERNDNPPAAPSYPKRRWRLLTWMDQESL